jgi:hypothetical protein
MKGPPSELDEIIKCVTSSNIEGLAPLTTGPLPTVPQFPLCGQWRKKISLLHLAAAYGSLTSIQYFLGKIDINIQTDDGV